VLLDALHSPPKSESRRVRHEDEQSDDIELALASLSAALGANIWADALPDHVAFLTVIPPPGSTPLAAVPFHALPIHPTSQPSQSDQGKAEEGVSDKGRGTSSKANGRKYLGDRFVVRTAPSLALLSLTETQAAQAAERAKLKPAKVGRACVLSDKMASSATTEANRLEEVSKMAARRAEEAAAVATLAVDAAAEAAALLVERRIDPAYGEAYSYEVKNTHARFCVILSFFLRFLCFVFCGFF